MKEANAPRAKSHASAYIVWGIALTLVHLSYALSTVTGAIVLPLPLVWLPIFITATLITFGIELGRTVKPERKLPAGTELPILVSLAAAGAIILLGYLGGVAPGGAVASALVAGFLLAVDRRTPDAGRGIYAKVNLVVAAGVVVTRFDPLYAGAVMALTSGIGLLMLGAYKLELNLPGPR